MLESPLHLLLLLPGIVLLTFGLAYAFQDIEDRAEAKSRCRACRQELAGQPAFCPHCGLRSYY